MACTRWRHNSLDGDTRVCSVADSSRHVRLRRLKSVIERHIIRWFGRATPVPGIKDSRQGCLPRSTRWTKECWKESGQILCHWNCRWQQAKSYYVAQKCGHRKMGESPRQVLDARGLFLEGKVTTHSETSSKADVKIRCVIIGVPLSSEITIFSGFNFGDQSV